MPSTKKLPYFQTKMRMPLKIHGGKFYLARRLFQLAPAHYDTFVDAYGGTGVMSANAPEGVTRIYNEKDWFKYNVLGVIKDRDAFENLYNILRQIEYSESTFLKAKERHVTYTSDRSIGIKSSTPSVPEAVNFITCNRQSRGGLGESFAWSERLRGGQPGDLNAWKTMIETLPQLHRRLKNLRLFNKPAIEVIEGFLKMITGNNFLYLDPPYPKESRTAKKAYGLFEMPSTIKEAREGNVRPCDSHEFLLSEIIKAPPYIKIMISSYDNKLYSEFLHDWHKTEIDMPNHSGQGAEKERRTEVVWTNYTN